MGCITCKPAASLKGFLEPGDHLVQRLGQCLNFVPRIHYRQAL